MMIRITVVFISKGSMSFLVTITSLVIDHGYCNPMNVFFY